MKTLMRRILLGTAVCVGFSSGSYALTVGDILTRARFCLKDQSAEATRQQFDDATLIRFVNDGQREANAFAWLLTQRYTFTLTAGTTEYTLPGDFMASQRVLFQKGGQANWTKLDQTSFNQLDAESTGWMGLSCGTIRKYYIYLTTSPVIGFTPCPSSASTGTVQMDYVANTIDATSTSETPFNGFGILAPYQASLADYATCRGYRMLEENDLAQPYCDNWLQAIVTMKSGILKQPDFNPSFGGRRDQ